jgi:probable HAF family extracellular repeat protein
MRTLSNLSLIAAATVALHGAGFTDAHTAANVVASRTYTQGVSSDGTTSVGYAFGGTAYKIVGTTYTALSNLSGGSSSFAYAASSNGSLIVGQATDSSGLQRAVYWDNTGIHQLTTLVYSTPGNESATATAVSAAGTTIVGYSNDGAFWSGPNPAGFSEDAGFYYRAGVFTSLYNKFSGNPTRATGVSADGNLIVGTIADSFNNMTMASGFIYNITTNTSYLVDAGLNIPAFNAIPLSFTQLTAISGNGQIAVGYAYNDTVSTTPSDALAFSYNTAGSGTYTALGKLGGPSSWSIARAASNDGSVIVGQSLNSTNKSEAFLYQSGAMSGLGFLGTGDESDATGVSADGQVIVGYSRVTAGGAVRHAFVYANQTMLDADEWLRSLNGPGSILAMTTNLNQLPLEGAHHRPLMSYDNMGKQSQAWATGDFGTASRQSDRHMTSGEIGVSQAYGDFVLGIAAGHASLNQDLLFGGSASISGNYLLAEADYRLADKESIVSLVLMRGDYDADTTRGYATGSGNDTSSGSTGLKTSSARLRIDGPAQKFISAVSATPFISYTATRTTANAYTETGGSFPASFGAQEHTAQEGRLGVTAKYVASPSTTLLFTAEWIHRFDGAGNGLTAISSTMGTLTAAGIAPTADQARFGFDIDHKLSADTLLNFSVHAAGIGPSSDVSAALSIRRAF